MSGKDKCKDCPDRFAPDLYICENECDREPKAEPVTLVCNLDYDPCQGEECGLPNCGQHPHHNANKPSKEGNGNKGC